MAVGKGQGVRRRGAGRGLRSGEVSYVSYVHASSEQATTAIKCRRGHTSSRQAGTVDSNSREQTLAGSARCCKPCNDVQGQQWLYNYFAKGVTGHAGTVLQVGDTCTRGRVCKEEFGIMCSAQSCCSIAANHTKRMWRTCCMYTRMPPCYAVKNSSGGGGDMMMFKK